MIIFVFKRQKKVNDFFELILTDKNDKFFVESKCFSTCSEASPYTCSDRPIGLGKG
jgi:hypothetical protein